MHPHGTPNGAIPSPTRHAVAYIRVSTEEQALEGYSLSDQERRAREAARRRGEEIAEVYPDHHTGKSRNRPGLRRLLANAQAGAIGTVIVTEVDRLARRASHALAIDEELHRYGAGCVFLEQSIDTTTDNGKLMFTIYAGMAEYERTQILRRTRNGRAQKAREGKASRSARVTPYGYRYIPEPQRADYEVLVQLGQELPHINGWVIVEREAAVVRRIFRDIAGGMTVATVCAALNHEGIPTKRGGPWRHATVWAMLHRSHFWGKATHGYSRRMEISDDKSVSRKNPDSSEFITIPVPAIVKEELAMRAQEQCHRNMCQSKRNAKYDYLLGGGLLRCGQCAAEGYVREDGLEYAMGGKKMRDGWRHYRCYHGRHRAYTGHRPSSYHAVNAEHVEQAVWNKLRELVADPERVVTQHAAMSNAHESEVQTLDADLAHVSEEIAKIEAKRHALLDLVGSLAKERLLQKDAEFAAQQSTLALRRTELQRQREHAAGAVLPIASVRAMCDLVHRRMDGTPSFEERREIVRLLVTKIVVTKERYRLYCVLPGLDEALEEEGDDTTIEAIASTAVRRCESNRHWAQVRSIPVALTIKAAEAVQRTRRGRASVGLPLVD